MNMELHSVKSHGNTGHKFGWINQAFGEMHEEGRDDIPVEIAGILLVLIKFLTIQPIPFFFVVRIIRASERVVTAELALLT